MSGLAAKHDGIRAQRPVVPITSPACFLRLTATAKLSEDHDVAMEQRLTIKAAMRTFAAVLAEEGIGLEFVVGQPRSPEMLMASLQALANGFDESGDDLEEIAAVA